MGFDEAAGTICIPVLETASVNDGLPTGLGSEDEVSIVSGIPVLTGAELVIVGRGAAVTVVLAALSGSAVSTGIEAEVVVAAPKYKHSGSLAGQAETGAGGSKIPSPPPSCRPQAFHKFLWHFRKRNIWENLLHLLCCILEIRRPFKVRIATGVEFTLDERMSNLLISLVGHIHHWTV